MPSNNSLSLRTALEKTNYDDKYLSTLPAVASETVVASMQRRVDDDDEGKDESMVVVER